MDICLSSAPGSLDQTLTDESHGLTSVGGSFAFGYNELSYGMYPEGGDHSIGGSMCTNHTSL